MKCASGCVRKTSAPVVAGSGASLPGTGSALKKIVHAAEQERADVAEARQRWREDQPSLDPARLVFIDGLRCGAVTAPFVIDRPMNGPIFRTYLERCLIPTLTPGDIVIMDNLSAHKVAGVREALEAAGAKLVYLPPYSPDLNPIEQLFAKLKALLRKAAERSIEALWTTIGNLLDAFSPEECANYLRHAGYASI